MKASKLGIVFIGILICVSCATGNNTGNNYDAVGTSLTEMNQHVRGHYYSSKIPDNFDSVQYKKAITEACKNSPACHDTSTRMFGDFDVRVRKLEGVNMFTVMLCDKDSGKKVMEAFSCTDMKVAVPTYKTGNNELCEFEKDWQKVVKDNCL